MDDFTELGCSLAQQSGSAVWLRSLDQQPRDQQPQGLRTLSNLKAHIVARQTVVASDCNMLFKPVERLLVGSMATPASLLLFALIPLLQRCSAAVSNSLTLALQEQGGVAFQYLMSRYQGGKGAHK
jgi:hypothetical protein